MEVSIHSVQKVEVEKNCGKGTTSNWTTITITDADERDTVIVLYHQPIRDKMFHHIGDKQIDWNVVDLKEQKGEETVNSCVV